jgi:hypothetical protein
MILTTWSFWPSKAEIDIVSREQGFGVELLLRNISVVRLTINSHESLDFLPIRLQFGTIEGPPSQVQIRAGQRIVRAEGKEFSGPGQRCTSQASGSA